MNSSDTKAALALKAMQGLLLNDPPTVYQIESHAVPLTISFVPITL